MEWFGVDVAFILSAEWQRLPVEVRANWLSLHAYCALHENGGVIEGAAGWRDREWRFAAGMTTKSAVAMMRHGLLDSENGSAYPERNPSVTPAETPRSGNLSLRGYDAEGERKTRETSRLKRKAAEARWSKDARASQKPDAEKDACNARDVRDETRRDVHTPVEPGLLVPVDPPKPRFDLDSAYAAYPRKEGKKRGLALLVKAIRTPADFELLMAAVKNYASHVRESRTEARFVKHFDTWVGEWEDWAPDDSGRPQNGAAPAPAARPTSGGFFDTQGDMVRAFDREAHAFGLVDDEGNPT